jgi:hypothetical protein
VQPGPDDATKVSRLIFDLACRCTRAASLLAGAAAAALISVPSPLAAERVDLELVLLADASRSIDNAEIEFQRRGYAEAVTNPAVLSAMTGGLHQRIAVTYVVRKC